MRLRCFPFRFLPAHPNRPYTYVNTCPHETSVIAQVGIKAKHDLVGVSPTHMAIKTLQGSSDTGSGGDAGDGDIGSDGRRRRYCD